MTSTGPLAYLSGIGLLTAGAVTARLISSRAPGVDELLLAIVVGVVVTNTVGIPDRYAPGVRTHKVWLGAGIVLMGASLSLSTIVQNGPILVFSVVSVTGFTLVVVEALSRFPFNIADRLASLLAAGASICGVSAVAAVGGSIDADEEHLAYAAATVLLFDAVTLFVYPAVGRLLDLSAQVFGIWAGLSMFSTGPVVAVGFAYSDAAGQWATVTKLTRNALIGVVAVGYAVYYTRQRLDSGGRGVRWRELWDRFPKFVVGFVLLAVVAGVGLLSPDQQQSIENAYGWLFRLAFVGLGTEMELRKLKCAGVRPVLVVFVTFVTVSVSSLLVLRAFLG
jgi:uncharacterized integral membrane protein (TIGR00698 family)